MPFTPFQALKLIEARFKRFFPVLDCIAESGLFFFYLSCPSQVSIAELNAVQEYISRKSFFKKALANGAAVFTGGAALKGASGGGDAKTRTNPAVAARPEPRSVPRGAERS